MTLLLGTKVKNTDYRMDTTNFVLIGHVDHGKSTCAGRILVETGTVTQRDIDRAINDATENNMKSWWLAYLLDLDEERIRGKTHEFMVMPIEYKGRNLNLIDVPGHRNFVKEMVRGSSYANLAVLICSAKDGELESGIKGQLYEHLIIARGMGISQLIVAVNKMDHDSVNWDMDIYENIKKKVKKIVSRLRFKDIQFVPISALEGTNVSDENTDGDTTLLDLIINTDIIKRKVKVFEDKRKIRVRCLFVNIESLVTIGYSCILHTADVIADCRIARIYHKRPFITDRDTGFIDVDIVIDGPVDIHTFVILRDNDRTVAMGRIVE